MGMAEMTSHLSWPGRAPAPTNPGHPRATVSQAIVRRDNGKMMGFDDSLMDNDGFRG